MFINNNISYHLLNAYPIAGTVLTSTIHSTHLPSELDARMNIPLIHIRELV